MDTGKTEKKNSGHIDSFLKLFQKAWGRFHAAQALEAASDRETQDILHWFEFHGLEASGEELEKMGKALSLVRQRRRQAKDDVILLAPAVEWAEKNENVRKNVQRLMEEVKKAEKSIEDRSYTDRTNIIAETLGKKDEAEE